MVLSFGPEMICIVMTVCRIYFFRPAGRRSEIKKIVKKRFRFGCSVVFLLQEWLKQLPLLDPHKAFIEFGMLPEFLRGLLRFIMVPGVIEHSGTHAVFAFLAHQ